MILLLKEKRIVVVAIVIVIVIVFVSWWIFFRSIGSFEELSKGIYSGDEYATLGKRFEDAGQWKDAEQAYLEAIKLDPALQLGAYLALDEIYQHKIGGKEDDIERLYLRGISQNPQSRSLLRGIAQYYERAKEYTRAYQWYSMVVNYYPQDEDSRNAMVRNREKIEDAE
jgi:tetratricopeptide (TPR) repeat protein